MWCLMAPLYCLVVLPRIGDTDQRSISYIEHSMILVTRLSPRAVGQLPMIRVLFRSEHYVKPLTHLMKEMNREGGTRKDGSRRS
jgi:hypothetical protein